MKRIKQLILLVIFLVFAFVFVLMSYKNATPVDFNYLLGTIKTNLSWLITGSFVFGVMVSFLFFAISNLFWKVKANNLAKRLENEKLMQQKQIIEEQFYKEKQTYVS